MAVAKDFFAVTENISYQVAAGKIDKELLHRILTAIMDGTYDMDEELKLTIYNAIS
jgi:death-on-curing protein